MAKTEAGAVSGYGQPKRGPRGAQEPPGPAPRAPSGTPQDAPVEAIVRLHIACNQHCFFCNTDARAENLHETPARVRAYIEANRHALHLSFSGGEPTLDRRLPGYIAYARELGVQRVIIQTNALLASYPAVADGLVDAGLTGAFVSLHAPRADVSDRITASPGTWEVTLRGLRNLLDRGVEVELNTVINQFNYALLAEHAAFIVERFPEIVAVTLSYVAPTGFCRVSRETIPRIRDVQPHLFAALDVFAAAGVTAILPDRCGIPLCTVRGYEHHHEALMGAPFAGGGLVTDDHTTAPGCQDCVWNDRCIGWWRRSVELWGTDDLVPVLEAVEVDPQRLPYAGLASGEVRRFLLEEAARLRSGAPSEAGQRPDGWPEEGAQS